NPVAAMLKSGHTIDKIFVSSDNKNPRLQLLLKNAREKKIPVQFIPSSALKRKANSEKHQGIVALLAEHPVLDLDELLHKIRLQKDSPILTMLDGIEDPHNFGAIIRSAEAAGLSGMIIQQRHSAPLSSVVAKASAGAISHFPIARVGNLAQAVDRLKQEGFWIVGSDERSDINYWELSFTAPTAVIVGNEGRGIRRLLKEKSDYLVRIPMYGKTESLNASVAAALLFYEIRRQRETL
ncbi:MAG TPA: 23S rRNA (guanosine(2251)-2'-O)-methyltransferase RlmB, partial [Bacteroidetes bacterium]|nr:23S rRNA (guanosine(2251)-2'-O)-methyltransferase RlmB [Bacteroidota bacterium]